MPENRDEFCYAPSISGDGTRLVYQANSSRRYRAGHGQRNDVFLHDGSGRENVCLSAPAAGPWPLADATDAVVSADGRQVAWQSKPPDRPAQIMVADVEPPGAASPPRLVSINERGEAADQDAVTPSLSADGSMVAFSSAADNLVDGVSWPGSKVYVVDAASGRVECVSEPQESDCSEPQLSADGSKVSYLSKPPHEARAVVVVDRKRGTRQRFESERECFQPTLSGDGRHVAWVAAAGRHGNRTYEHTDIVVTDLESGGTQVPTRACNGAAANGDSWFPSLSGDGRYLVFSSDASNLVPDDRNGRSDVFVHDLRSGATARLSTHADGAPMKDSSLTPVISADGKVVAFSSCEATPEKPHDRQAIFVARNVLSEEAQGDLLAAAAEAPPPPSRGAVERVDDFVVINGIRVPRRH